jgi:hypothetical protein
MQRITILDDQQCETLGGGFGGWGQLFNISTKSMSGVTNNVTQTNSALNLGGGSWGYSKGGYSKGGYGKGGFGMFSSISNLQGNGAELVSVVL